MSAFAEDDSGRLLVAGADATGGFARRFQLTLDPLYETRFANEFWNSGLNHYFMTADPIEYDLTCPTFSDQRFLGNWLFAGKEESDAEEPIYR